VLEIFLALTVAGELRAVLVQALQILETQWLQQVELV
jgi:hypothetical protein